MKDELFPLYFTQEQLEHFVTWFEPGGDHVFQTFLIAAELALEEAKGVSKPRTF